MIRLLNAGCDSAPKDCCAHCQALKGALAEQEICTCDWWGWRGAPCPVCVALPQGEGK